MLAPHYGLDGAANFEGKHWHLHVAQPLRGDRRALGRTERRVRGAARRARARSCFAAREQRIRPGRDEKILTSWNALMIRGMARAARVFGRADWLASARRALDFIRAHAVAEDGAGCSPPTRTAARI